MDYKLPGFIFIEYGKNKIGNGNLYSPDYRGDPQWKNQVETWSTKMSFQNVFLSLIIYFTFSGRRDLHILNVSKGAKPMLSHLI